jgi:hypothetical protein
MRGVHRANSIERIVANISGEISPEARANYPSEVYQRVGIFAQKERENKEVKLLSKKSDILRSLKDGR